MDAATEIAIYQAWADVWQESLTTHRADIFTRTHGDCIACRELEASMRYNRYAVRTLQAGQRPLTGTAWAAGQRAAAARAY